MSANGRCGRRRMWQQQKHRDANALEPASSPHIWTGLVADAFQVSTGDWYYLCGLGRVGFPATGRTVQMWTGTHLFSHNEDSPSYVDWCHLFSHNWILRYLCGLGTIYFPTTGSDLTYVDWVPFIFPQLELSLPMWTGTHLDGTLLSCPKTPIM
jgi:hypothetical protein